MEMTNACEFIKSENLRIMTESPIPNMYNPLLKTKLMKTENRDISANEQPQKNNHSVAIKTEPVTEKDQQISVMENHETLIPQVNQMLHSEPKGRDAGGKRFTCDHCDKEFSKSTNLKVHKRIHTVEKPFACEWCDKRFRQRRFLKAHHRTHTREKPFACPLCDKRYSQANSLAEHKRTHTREKPLVCDICDKRFIQASCLARHKRSHTGEKPFLCILCDKRFSQSGSLGRHQRKNTCMPTTW